MMTHIFCVGKVNSDRDIVIVPAYAPDIDDAYAIGEMDFDDGEACEPLIYFSDLAAIEAYVMGWKAASLAPLQDVIDAGAELQELRDGIADDEYHASGNW